MNSPPQKCRQIRRYACYCPVCNGQERDGRTIQQPSLVHVCSVSHTGPSAGNPTNMFDSALNPQISLSHQPELELNPQTSLSHPSKSTVDPSPDLTLSKSDLTTYVLRETLIKLKRGHSQVEIEEHLQNTAKLIGGKGLPETWKYYRCCFN